MQPLSNVCTREEQFLSRNYPLAHWHREVSGWAKTPTIHGILKDRQADRPLVRLRQHLLDWLVFQLEQRRWVRLSLRRQPVALLDYVRRMDASVDTGQWH